MHDTHIISSSSHTADTNVVLHQIDLLENHKITNVIVLQTVLDEVKHINLSIYNRLRALTGNPDRHFHVFANEHHRYIYSPVVIFLHHSHTHSLTHTCMHPNITLSIANHN